MILPFHHLASTAFTLLLSPLVGAQDLRRVGAGAFSDSESNYGFVKNLCALLAHKSIQLGDKLYIDGGMAKFNWQFSNGTPAEVLDLNPYTGILDLSQEFSIGSLPLKEIKRPDDVPVLNRFSIWSDSTSNSYYISGGHFYIGPYWNESDYVLAKEDIPGYNIWKFDASSEKWTPERFEVVETREEQAPRSVDPNSGALSTTALDRRVSAASGSIPSKNVSYEYGGYRGVRSSALGDGNYAENSLIIYNHTSHTIRELKNPVPTTNGTWHGTFTHLPCGDWGMFINLMAEEIPQETNFTESDYTGTLGLRAVPWTSVNIFDPEREEWYRQPTTFFNNDEPEPRSRFCAALAHDWESDTWDLWIFGGQSLKDPSEGVSDIWVLSMPSFVWVKVTDPTGYRPIRTHSCDAVGNTLVIVGGYPPGKEVDPDIACPPRRQIVQLFDMNTNAFVSKFVPNGVYKQPDEIRAKSRLEPQYASPRIEELFSACPTDPGNITETSAPPQKPKATPRGKAPVGAIAGGVIGGLAFLAVLAWLVIFLRRRSANRQTHADFSTVIEPTVSMQNGPEEKGRVSFGSGSGRAMPRS